MKWTHLERVLQFKVKGEIQNTVRIEKRGEKKNKENFIHISKTPNRISGRDFSQKCQYNAFKKKRTRCVEHIMRDGEKQLSKTVREMNNVGEKVEINKHGKSVRVSYDSLWRIFAFWCRWRRQLLKSCCDNVMFY